MTRGSVRRRRCHKMHTTTQRFSADDPRRQAVASENPRRPSARIPLGAARPSTEDRGPRRLRHYTDWETHLMIRRQLAHCLLGAAALIAVAGCSAGAGASGQAASAPHPTTIAQASAADQVIEVTAGDYYFKPNQITIRPGTITVNLFNEGARRH